MANKDDVPRCVNCRISLCGCVVNSLISLCVFICVASLLVWMMLRSNAVKFQVHDAELTRFDLDLQNNLHYNLSLNISVRNSNSHIGVHYDKFKAMVYYSDQRLESILSMPSFYQGHKSTKVVKTVFQAQNLVLLGEDGLTKFEDERKLGVYGIDVKVRIKARVLFAHLVTWPMKPTIRCHLNMPLSSSNISGGFHFQPTKCHVDI